MRFLLDTCVLSDFAQGQRQTLESVKAAAPEDLAASAITQMEIEYGLLLNSKIARRLGPAMDAFFGTIRVLHYDEGAAEATAKARAILKRRGRPIGAYDILIAGTGLAHDLTWSPRTFASSGMRSSGSKTGGHEARETTV